MKVSQLNEVYGLASSMNGVVVCTAGCCTSSTTTSTSTSTCE